MNPILAAHTACVWEVLARKVGNVHPGADFLDLTYLDFIHSAGALAKALTECVGSGVGQTILRAVQLRREVTPSNTNLGIILLLVPLVKSESREQLEVLLQSLTLDDATDTYEAIRIASAGGLGEVSEQSVGQEPTVTLLEAMRLAADRDMIAKQYTTGFADVYDFGVPNLVNAFEKFGSVEAAIVDSQLRWLAAFRDSLITRKYGPRSAERIRLDAGTILALGGIATPRGRGHAANLDHRLRDEKIRYNPGTTADLVTACLFIALRDGKLKPSDTFPWPATDWL